MTGSSEQRHACLIDSVAKSLRTRGLSGRGLKEAERFLRAFYAHVPPDDIAEQPPENLAGAALSIWGLMAQRKPGHAKIRVYNPVAARNGWEVPGTAIEIVNDDMPFLVDSVTAEINRRDAEVQLVIHPILAVERDAKGNLKHVDPGDEPTAEGLPESCMLVLITELPLTAHKALAAGLTNSPIADTIRDTLAWFKSLPAERQEELRAGMSRAKEASVLEAWHSSGRAEGT